MELDPPVPRRLDLPSGHGGDTDYDADTSKDPTTDPNAAEAERKRKLHAQAIERFKESDEFFSEQRAREVEDLKFYRAVLPEDQWPDYMLAARRGNEETNTAERPCLVMNESEQPVRLSLNEARQMRLALHLKPNGSKATPKEAETRQGLVRFIQNQSVATQGRLWALEHAMVMGRGWYRIDKRWASDGPLDEESSDIYDQDVVVGAVLNQHSVYPDPAFSPLDPTVASYYLILDDLSHEEFTRRFPNAREPKAGSREILDLGQWANEWTTEKTYRIAEYYYVEQTTHWHILDIETDVMVPPETFPKGQDGSPQIPAKGFKVRLVPKRVIKWALISALEVLDEAEWDGRFLPIIPVLGRVSVIDGKVVYKGIIANAKDPQRALNYGFSSLIEQVAVGTKAPYLADYRQTANYRAWWDHLNEYNFPVLYYDRIVDDVDLGPPQRNVQEPPILAMLQMLNQASNKLKSATGRFGASLGDITPDRSGKAIKELKMQGELGTGDFVDQLATISMPYEGAVINDLLYYVYDRQGRVTKLLGDREEDEQTVMLNQPYTVNPKTKQPQPYEPPGMFSRAAVAVKRAVGVEAPAPEIHEHRLTKAGEYTASVVVGRSTQTQREENVALLQGLLEAVPDPAFAKVVVPILAKYLDGPAAKELADALDPAKGIEDMSPAAKQLIGQMKQELEQVKAAATQMQQELQSKQQDVQAKAMQADMAAQAKLQLSAMEAALEREKMKTQVLIEIAKLKAKEGITLLENEAERMLQDDAQQHEREMQARELDAKGEEQLREATLTMPPAPKEPSIVSTSAGETR